MGRLVESITRTLPAGKNGVYVTADESGHDTGAAEHMRVYMDLGDWDFVNRPCAIRVTIDPIYSDCAPVVSGREVEV